VGTNFPARLCPSALQVGIDTVHDNRKGIGLTDCMERKKIFLPLKDVLEDARWVNARRIELSGGMLV